MNIKKKYYIYYDYKKFEFCVDYNYINRTVSTIYFLKAETAEKAIKICKDYLNFLK